MFNVIISFGPANTQWQFMFNKHEAAKKVLADYATAKNSGTELRVVDDFGNEASIATHTICGVLVDELKKTADAAIERHLNQQRANVKAQNKVRNDPLLNLAAPPMVGPNGLMQPLS